MCKIICIINILSYVTVISMVKYDKKKYYPPKDMEGMYKEGIEYAITINPKDELQGEPILNLIQRGLIYNKLIMKLLKLLKGIGVEYKLYPELSTPDPVRVATCRNTMPRLHYHGYIKIKDIVLFYLWGYTRLIKKIGMIKIKTIDDNMKWFKYITKDTNQMKVVTDRLNIPYMLSNWKVKDSVSG